MTVFCLICEQFPAAPLHRHELYDAETLSPVGVDVAELVEAVADAA